MSMLSASIRRTGPLGDKISRIRAERIAAGLLKDDEPEQKKTVVLISENGGKLVEAVEPPPPPPPRKKPMRRLAGDDIKAVKLDGVIYPTISEIQAATCEYFGIDRIDLMSRRRELPTIRPRQIAVYLCKCLTIDSYPVIAKRFDRDHTTAIAAVLRIQLLMDRDREFADKVNELKAIITAAANLARS